MLASVFSGLLPMWRKEFDCLHDNGLANAQALKAAGDEVQLEEYMEMTLLKKLGGVVLYLKSRWNENGKSGKTSIETAKEAYQ